MAVNLQHGNESNKFTSFYIIYNLKVVYPIQCLALAVVLQKNYLFTDIYGFYGCKFMAVNANIYGRKIKHGLKITA